MLHWKVLVCTVLAAVALPAQQLFSTGLRKSHLPAGSAECVAVAPIDVDADGDLDLVFGMGLRGATGAQNRLLRNDGEGRFADITASHLPADRDHTRALAVGDVDGDGDADLVLGNRGFAPQRNRLYLNDGSGAFTDASATHLLPDSDATTALALGDVDGDGDLDMVVGNTPSSAGDLDRLLLNDGSGRFVDATARLPAVVAPTVALALGDVDGDGDLDLLAGNQADQNRLYLNDGTGTFMDATTAGLPARKDKTTDLTLADLDGDSDLDLVVTNADFLLSPLELTRLLLNDGNGRFTDAPATWLGVGADYFQAVAAGDLDADGDTDLVLGNGWDHDRLLLNDGSGQFTDASDLVPGHENATTDLALADLDGDGRTDVVVATDGQQRLYLNPDNGGLVDATAPRLPDGLGATRAIATGDVDGDGDTDLIAAHLVFGNRYETGRAHVYLNDGHGVFTDAHANLPQPLPPQPACVANRSALLADLDGDGDLDLVLGSACFDTPSRLYLNDGSGVFQDATAASLAAPGLVNSLAAADVDRDGDLDLLCGLTGANRLFLNAGAAVFTDASANLPADLDDTRALLCGDVDGDGDADLIAANRGQSRLYLNDGSGRFAAAPAGALPGTPLQTWAASLVDVDADADLDVVLGNRGPSALYLNDGSGTFTDATATRLPSIAWITRSLAAGDVDDDGDPDLVFGNDGPNGLLLNDGAGYFQDGTRWMPAAAATTGATALADLDRDGDLDVVFGTSSASATHPHVVLANRMRDLATPWLLTTGSTYRLEVTGRPGLTPLFQIAVVVVAPAEQRTPLPPFGTFGLAPQQLVQLPPVYLPPPGTTEVLTLPIPADPALRGLPLFAQAAFVDPLRPARLSNVVADVVLR